MAHSFVSSHRLVVGSVALLAGCYTSTSVLDSDSGQLDAGPNDALTIDAFAVDVGTDAGRDAGPDGGSDAGRPNEPPPGAVVCGGAICGAGQECCLLTARCVAVGDPSCVPTSTTDPNACARQSDCPANETCEVELADFVGFRTGFCGGVVGVCRRPLTLDMCSGGQLVCGCDGRTYASACHASQAGVRVANAHGPCGTPSPPNVPGGALPTCTSDAQCGSPLANAHCDIAAGVCALDDPFIPCGVASECPSGRACCGITGACYDPARPETCAVPPLDAPFPCGNDQDCARWDGTYWMLPHPASSYCDTAGCSGVGGCVVPQTSCSGTLNAVCGCDGNTYQNGCEADRARVSIAHAGAC